MLSTEQETELVSFIIDDFGYALIEDDFVECCLSMFEDIAGLECLSDSEIRSITNRLWSNYVKHRI